jgi:hypothetical protein
MTTFEDAPAAAAAGEGGAAAAPSSEQVAGLREAATAVLAMTEVKKGAVGKLRSSRLNAAAADDRVSRGRLSSITKTVSGVGSGAIGGAKGFRDVQKQKLLDAKERLAQSRDSQVSGQY